MIELYFWNSYHAGDIIFTRPLVRAVLDRHDVRITWGCYRNHRYLIEDLPVRIVVDPRTDGAVWDLSYLCPPGHYPINTWCGQYPETRRHIWASVVETYNRQVRAHGLEHLTITSHTVPMVDFAPRPVRVRENAVYVANGTVRSRQSRFVFHIRELAATFPHLCFYCVADPECQAPNVVNCAHLNLVELSALSNHCRAIIGRGGGAFDCTFTEPNRHKPRAVMGLACEHNPTTWEYPGLRVAYLDTRQELVDFLASLPPPEPVLDPAQPAPADTPAAVSDAAAAVLAATERHKAGGPMELAADTAARGRLDVARHFASVAPEQLAEAFGSSWGTAWQHLLSLRLSGLQAGLLAAPADELAWVRGLPGVVSDPTPDQLPSLLATMLYLEPTALPPPRDLALIPQWLQWDYLRFLLTLPRQLQHPGQLQLHVDLVQQVLGAIQAALAAHPESPRWQEAAVCVAHHLDLTPALAVERELSPLWTTTAALYEQGLRKLDVDTDAKYLPTRRRGAGSVTRLGLIMSRVPRTPECLNALALWQQLDPDRFVPFLFVDGAAEDDLRPLFAPRGVVVALVPIIREQVPLIRNYHLDVVVFGSPVMPTAEFPTPLAAHRLAPWQVALDGTCGLTGLAAVDRWILGRAVAVDPDPATTLLIPGSGRCYDYTHLTAQSAATEPLTRAMAHLPADAVVFASGAHLRKMTPEMLLVWAEILAQVPGSFLLLAPLGPHLPGTWAVEPMLEAIGQNFTARGVDPGRVVVVVRPVATARQASERWRIADIWLDTWPWSSFFSAADAIAAGVPVVAWEGTLPRSRRSAAILRDLGLPELIAGTRSAYVDLAARLGRDAAFRHQITARVRAAWAAVPAYADTGAYGCHLRDAILELVEHERR